MELFFPAMERKKFCKNKNKNYLKMKNEVTQNFCCSMVFKNKTNLKNEGKTNVALSFLIDTLSLS